MGVRIRDVHAEAVKLYTVPNPAYYQMIRLSKNPRFTPKTKSLTCDGMAPPGAAYWSARYGKRIGNGGVPTVGALKFPDATLELRDYQIEPAAIAGRRKGGLIEAPTGAGKSAISADLIRATGLKTLIVVHSTEMLVQFVDSIRDYLGYEAGAYYGAKKEIKDITVTTYMSAASKRNLFEDYGFEMLIVDEADLFCTDRYLEFLCKFNTVRNFGFTATPKVEAYDVHFKNQPKLMDRLWGPRVVVETAMQTDVLERIEFNHYEKDYTDEYGIKIVPKEWHEFRRELDDDLDRKEAQIAWILDNTEPTDSALVLLDRVGDVDYFEDKLGFKFPGKVYKLHGQMKDAQRKDVVLEYKKGGGILVANSKIASRGFDVPDANVAFICCPMKGESPLRQAVGRIIRWKKGKTSVLHDWADSSLFSQISKRQKIYKSYFPSAEIN